MARRDAHEALPRRASIVNRVAEIQSPRNVMQDWNLGGRIEDFYPTFANWRFDWLDRAAMIRDSEQVLEYPISMQGPWLVPTRSSPDSSVKRWRGVARSSSFALLLAFWCAGAAADWTPVGKGDYIASAYADRATIQRSGAMAKMSGMYDFKRQDFTPEGKALFSTVVLREYDCGQRRVRLLSSIDFAGRMGTGEAVDRSARVGRWEDIVAGALDEAFWKLACNG